MTPQIIERIALRYPPPVSFLFIPAMLFLCLPRHVSAFEGDDTLSAAAPVIADSNRVLPDTLVIDRAISLSRGFDQLSEPANLMTESEIPWVPKRSPADMALLFPGAYLRDPSSTGQYSQLSFRGADWRSVAFTADGRLMNDPASGTYNPFHYPADYIDRFEVVPGPRAFLYGLNGAGATINAVTKQYDSDRPYSKINYSEGPHGYAYFDGTISQNITSRMNVALGLQRQIEEGRYANSQHEAWNGRARIRYRLTDNLSVILSEFLTSTKTQLNGGIKPDALSLSNAFFPLQTTMRNEDAYEKLSRNDVDLALVGYFIHDSTSPTRLSFYYSNNFREYRDETGGSIPNSVFIQSDHTSSWMGALLTQRLESGFHRFDLRTNLEIRQLEGSPNLGRRRNVIGSISAKEEVTLGELLTVAGYGRYDRYLNKDYAGFGADGRLNPVPGLSLFGGGSFSWRVPTYQELYWTDSTVSRQGPILEEEHRHVELGAEVSDNTTISLRVVYFNRRIVHPILLQPFGTGSVFPGILFSNGDEVINQGVDFRFWLRLWHFYLEGTGMYLLQKSGSITLSEYPEFSFTGGIYFWEKIIDDHLNLKAGFQGKIQSGQTGTEFNGEALAYVGNANRSITGGASVDFVLTGRIGDAYVHFVWENLTEAEYFSTPFYPVRDRAIRFGIAWEFLD